MKFENSKDFDEYLKKRAEEEPFSAPQSFKTKIENAMAELPEKEKEEKRRLSFPVRRLTVAAASMAFLTLFLLPNISVTYGEAMEKLPVVGKLVKVVTIRNYFYSDENHEMDIKVPEIKDESSEAAGHVNENVDRFTSELVKQFYKELETAGGHGSVSVEYETVTDTEDWFTLKLEVSETAGSSNRYFRYYHIDKRTGQIVKLGDMFVDESYQEIITEEIKRQMKERMKKDENVVYWIEKDDFGKEFAEIGEDHNFYWDKDGNLVITFDKYEVGPGSSGEPEFVIKYKLFKEILKPQYRNTGE